MLKKKSNYVISGFNEDYPASKKKKYTGDYYFTLLTDLLFSTCSQKVDVKCNKPEVDIKNIKRNAL